MRTRNVTVAVCAAALLLGCGSKGPVPIASGDGGVDAETSAALGEGGGHAPDGSSPTDGAGPTDTGSPPVDGEGPPPSSGITITVEPDGTKDAAGLLASMNAATTAVHVEMYLLTNSTYIDALIDLKNAGKDVKVVLNQTFPSGTSTEDTNADSYSKLMAAGVDVHWAPTTTGFDAYTHEKAVIIDPAGGSHSQAWIMTMNLDYDGPDGNREFLADDTNAADVAEAEAIFEADYAGTDITPTGSLVVAPAPQNDAVTSLVGLINGAKSTILLELEEFDDEGYSTEEMVFNALADKAKAGVTVDVVLEDSSDSEQTTAVNSIAAAGGHVVGYSCSGKLDIHAKALVADGTTAYVGSENFSEGSLGYNRELGIIFTEASEVAKVNSTIAGDFAAGAAYSSTCSF